MRKNQSGMTFIGWVLVLTIAGCIVMVALQLFPVYMEGFKVKSIVASLENNSNLNSPKDIRDTLSKRFSIDEVKNVRIKQHVKIERRGNGFLVVVDYERRAEIVGNLSAIAHFKYEVDVKGNGGI